MGWRRGDNHQDQQRVRPHIVEPVLHPLRGDERFAGPQGFRGSPEGKSPRALHDVVYLIEVGVGVGFLGLTWRDAVEIELDARR